MHTADKAVNAEQEGRDHEDDQQYRNAVHRAGRVPDESATDEAGKDGGEFAVQRIVRQLLQRTAHGGDVGIKENAADEIHGEIVDDVDL